MKAKIKKIFTVIINVFVIKRKNKIYVRPRIFFPKSKCDLINNSASNMFHFLESYIQHEKDKKVYMYIEYSDLNRLHIYKKYIEETNSPNLHIKFVVYYRVIPKTFKRYLTRFLNLLRRLSSTIWLCETGDTFMGENLPSQKVICMNYFISCKNDLIVGKNFRWSYLDALATTSLLASQIISSSIGVKLDKCVICGFPRNDVLFQKDKEKVVREWIYRKIGFSPKHIFLYAPTYRDYDLEKQNEVFRFIKNLNQSEKDMIVGLSNSSIRPLLGYESNGLENFLKKTDSVFIYNLHPLQKVDVIQENNLMLAYEETYEFTLYDLMAISDCMITDYSSIGFDFLLTDKPIIYNIYDFNIYEKLRGVSYEPYSMFCPGPIVTDWIEMEKALWNVVNNVDCFHEQRCNVTRLLHKHLDGKSTERVIDYFDTLIR